MKNRERRNKVLQLIAFLEEDNGNNITERAFAINRLEKLTGMDFKTSKQYDASLPEIKRKMALAKRLEELREEAKLSQKQLGKRLKLPADWIDQMEKGTRTLDKKAMKFIGE
jgi:DNA-binding transcriptional regulator YiaG